MREVTIIGIDPATDVLGVHRAASDGSVSLRW